MNKTEQIKSLNTIKDIFNNSFYVYRKTKKIQKYEGVDGLIIENCKIKDIDKNIQFIKKNKIKLDIKDFKQNITKLDSILKQAKTKVTIHHETKENKNQIKKFISSKKTGIEEIKDIKSKCKKIFNKNKKQEITIQLNSEKDFILQIAKIRSLKITLQTIFKDVDFKKQVFIFCNIKTNRNQNKYDNLIRYCFQALSALIGGANALKSNTKDEESIINEINQQLILKYETNINDKKDIIYGSIEIENKINEILCFLNIKNTKQKKNTKINPAGEFPFTRGPYKTMYTEKPWTIRQYAGFSTAKESNNFYKKNLKRGQKGLSVAFDLATHRGYNSNNKRVKGDVGKTGVAVDSIEDIRELFDEISLSDISVSMTMNGAVLPIMAFYIAHAIEKKINLKNLSGTIQNDILKEFMVRNTFIYPPKESMRIISDIFKYTSLNMPKFNNISVSGYHMQEAGASTELELAYTIANGLEYVKTGVKAGLKIDDFAPRISFFWGTGMNFFQEICKMRAARYLWAHYMKKYNPKNNKSMILRAHCQTSGWSLTQQKPINNIARTAIEAMSSVLGGTQSLHTNSFDEAIALPSEISSKIALKTQTILQEETNITNYIDPFGGSIYLEEQTKKLIQKTKKHIKEITKMGGMTKSIELGYPKTEIEKSSIKKQTMIEKKETIIVGVNKFKEQENKIKKIKFLEIDNKKVLKEQIKKIEKTKKERNEKQTQQILNLITECCENNKGNLLDLSVKAAQSGATIEEISFACEKVFKRYIPKFSQVTGIYSNQLMENKEFKKAKKQVLNFEKREGRRPRILIAKVGQDGHDRGSKIIATGFSDVGFDVDLGALFQTPQEVVKQAVENDVHVIGISSLGGAHKTLIPEIIRILKKVKKEKIKVITGGIIPEKDHKFLYSKGVAGIFGPGTIISEAAIKIINKIGNK